LETKRKRMLRVCQDLSKVTFKHLRSRKTAILHNPSFLYSTATASTGSAASKTASSSSTTMMISGFLSRMLAGTAMIIMSIGGGIALMDVNYQSNCVSGRWIVEAKEKEIGAVAAKEVIEKGDKIYEAGQTENLHNFLKEQLALYPEDGRIHWRFARACHDLSLLKKDQQQKKDLIYEAHKHAVKAIELSPKDFAAHKWAGITLSSVGDFEGTKIKISNAFIIKELFEKAISLNGKDPTSRHLLGLWCFTFADMPWYMVKIASALFATPPSSTYEEALSHFLAAEKLEEGFYKKNTLMIAKTYAKMNKKAEAKIWAQKALSMKVNNPDDQEAHKEAETLAKSL